MLHTPSTLCPLPRLHLFTNTHTTPTPHPTPTPPPAPQALGLLLEAGVSCLPVVDTGGVLLDVYARADITLLAKVRVGGGGGGGGGCAAHGARAHAGRAGQAGAERVGTGHGRGWGQGGAQRGEPRAGQGPAEEGRAALALHGRQACWQSGRQAGRLALDGPAGRLLPRKLALSGAPPLLRDSQMPRA